MGKKLSGKKLEEAKAAAKKAKAWAKEKWNKMKWRRVEENYEEETERFINMVTGFYKKAWKKMSSVDYKKHLKELRAKISKAGSKATAAMKKQFNNLRAGAKSLYKNFNA